MWDIGSEILKMMQQQGEYLKKRFREGIGAVDPEAFRQQQRLLRQAQERISALENSSKRVQ